jgi:PPOX class probable FMN-dependent enzyme
MSVITDVAALEALYGQPGETALLKEVDHLTPEYRAFIGAAPFAVLSTIGPEGIDGSPRGDKPGFVRVADPRTLMLPDRRGNNRVDSLRNVVRDPRAALLFMVPGSTTTLRVNGRAHVDTDRALCDSFIMDGKPPRSVLVLNIETVYFQCARAIIRADLWNPDNHADPKTLPTPGKMLATLTDDRFGGAEYDREWPDRARKSLW